MTVLCLAYLDCIVRRELREETHHGIDGLQGDIHSEIGALREDVYYDMHNLFFLQAEMRI